MGDAQARLGAGEHRLPGVIAQALAERGVSNDIISDVLADARKDLSRASRHSLDQLHQFVVGCRDCSVASTPYLPPKGWATQEPDLLLVAPQPFTGSETDRRLIVELKNLGLRSSQCGYTSVMRCLAHKDAPSQDRAAIASHCAEKFLFAEIERMNPKVIVPIGVAAAGMVIGETTSEECGVVHYLGAWVVVPVSARWLSARSGEGAMSDFRSQMRVAMDAAGVAYGDS